MNQSNYIGYAFGKYQCLQSCPDGTPCYRSYVFKSSLQRHVFMKHGINLFKNPVYREQDMYIHNYETKARVRRKRRKRFGSHRPHQQIQAGPVDATRNITLARERVLDAPVMQETPSNLILFPETPVSLPDTGPAVSIEERVSRARTHTPATPVPQAYFDPEDSDATVDDEWSHSNCTSCSNTITGCL